MSHLKNEKFILRRYRMKRIWVRDSWMILKR